MLLAGAAVVAAIAGLAWVISHHRTITVRNDLGMRIEVNDCVDDPLPLAAGDSFNAGGETHDGVLYCSYSSLARRYPAGTRCVAIGSTQPRPVLLSRLRVVSESHCH